VPLPPSFSPLSNVRPVHRARYALFPRKTAGFPGSRISQAVLAVHSPRKSVKIQEKSQ
jgi:hypothetical protein